MGEGIYRTLSREEFEELSSRILYEDNHLLIFNKRVGEIVQKDETGDEPLSNTLAAFIAQRDGKPGRVFVGVPHRLDRPVSGVTVFAKTSKALERMNAMFRDGKGDRLQKKYWALVEKCPSPAEGELKHYLVKNERQNKSYVCDASVSGAKEARLHYRLLGATERYFLVEVTLLTGRHHQIRCQLAAIGCPIKGDLKYGARRSNRDKGISLHARNISFEHPVRHDEVNVTAPTVMESYLK